MLTSKKYQQYLLEVLLQKKDGYTLPECIRQCRLLKLREEANCDYIKESKTKCEEEFISKFQKRNVFGICSKYCPLECDTISYLISINNQQFPTTGNISKNS